MSGNARERDGKLMHEVGPWEGSQFHSSGTLRCKNLYHEPDWCKQ